MKKILFVSICILFASCAKIESIQEPEMVTVSFEPKYVTSGSMTRSGNPYLDIIELQNPKIFNITIRNLDLDREYMCVCGENLTIPVGKYQVVYILDAQAHASEEVDQYPKFAFGQDTFVVDSETTVIQFELAYTCYVVFVDSSEVSSCSAIIDGVSYDLYEKNGYLYGFFTCFEFDMQLTPAIGSDFEPTTIKFHYKWPDVKDADVLVEHGKYYVIHPTSIEKNDCVLGASLPTMTEGEV